MATRVAATERIDHGLGLDAEPVRERDGSAQAFRGEGQQGVVHKLEP
jgi:hypothetical protein